MAISLDVIYQPLNQFFLQKFNQDGGTSAFFCFAQLPVGFYDSDFLVPIHHEWGPYEPLAVEQFSNLVDRIPKLNAEGKSVWLNQSRISDLYHDEMLRPSLPFIPNDADATTKQAVIDSFSQVKRDALFKWDNNSNDQSILLPGSSFSPAGATPQDWWKADSDVWTSQSFDIQGATTTVSDPPSNQILRLKIQDTVLRPILQSHVDLAGTISPIPKAVIPPVMLFHPSMVAAKPIFAATLASSATVHPPQVAVMRTAAQPIMATDGPSPLSVAIHSDLIARSMVMPFNQRIDLQSMLAQNAPTQTVTVTDVTVSFDYCLVTVDRPWIHTAFLNNTSWYVPGQIKGILSANDGHGVPAIPVGFVALKNLRITGPWTPVDITNLEQTIQFGPFNIDAKVVAGAIGQASLQVIGWILQATSQGLLDLPPMGDPNMS